MRRRRAVRRQTCRRRWTLVQRLDPDRREAFALTQLAGLSYEEAATIVGCPIGTIRSRVARARGDLRAAMSDADDAAAAS